MEKSRSFQAGIEAAKAGTNISNSYPFNHEEWSRGYRTIKPEAKDLFEEILGSAKSTLEKIEALTIREFAENG